MSPGGKLRCRLKVRRRSRTERAVGQRGIRGPRRGSRRSRSRGSRTSDAAAASDSQSRTGGTGARRRRVPMSFWSFRNLIAGELRAGCDDAAFARKYEDTFGRAFLRHRAHDVRGRRRRHAPALARGPPGATGTASAGSARAVPARLPAAARAAQPFVRPYVLLRLKLTVRIDNVPPFLHCLPEITETPAKAGELSNRGRRPTRPMTDCRCDGRDDVRWRHVRSVGVCFNPRARDERDLAYYLYWPVWFKFQSTRS